MTSPEGDDGLEESLRRALSAAADEVEPGAGGLDKIRARIGGRPPRPWLLSVLSGVVDRVRNWTWHGHWAWKDSLPRPAPLWGGLRRWASFRRRRASFPRPGTGWLRLTAALAGVAVIAGITLSVQPVRHAILQASTALNGGSGPPRSDAGTEGNGTRASGVGGTPSADGATPGAGQASQGSTATASGGSQTSAPNPASCVAKTLPVRPSTTPGATPSTGPSATPTAAAPTATPSPTGAGTDVPGTTPAAEVPSPLTASPTTSARPYNTSTDASTCPVVPPSNSPTPAPAPAPAPASSPTSSLTGSPASSSSSPIPTPADVSPTLAPSSAETTPAETTSGRTHQRSQAAADRPDNRHGGHSRR
jgi:hypothetical protein